MKKILLLSLAGFFSLGTATSQTVMNARNAALNSNVTVRGVAINGSELGIIRYIQDNTGGISAYGGNVSTINKGDSVLVNGTLTSYNNLFEMSPVTFTVVSTNATVPAPNVITPAQFNEATEGTLIKILNCSFGAAAGGIFPATATNYTVTSGGQSFAVRTNTFLSGTSIPTGTVNITGVSSQFCSTPSSGCTTGYQLLIRTNADLSTATVPTGIAEQQLANSVSVFPNPTNTEINFKLSAEAEVSAVSITNILGKVVYASSENTGKIDVSTLANGVYNLTVATKGNTCQTKFVVTH